MRWSLSTLVLNDPYFIEKKLVPERRLLTRHHSESDGHSVLHVHRDLRQRRVPLAGLAHWNEMRTLTA